ncbi:MULTISPECIES: dihydroxyacetone kinase subunit DhaK [Brucella/Ochrobactrum group]|uniref:Dihydroxyacetone kinase subunit DhaK n=2 Tax=Ochrobactrum TaxID=528 RepID=A0ABY2Y8Y1_9HYPH|nr:MULTISPECIES: dihydroxyacetone kinase subunit DhaK [Brucella]MCI0999061.1 dihydroxyacetone kinase subunit DhaK [Ochrobactrum sp. C6C9]RRD23776.1 dihydroxyacetone kinase subunit DhaK [Brucellaceae bacterium VT-16-1752]WHT43884.1 dihydroxyacetone kinase subunit DhaK [Ochrobactrum sp. SSR]MDX4075114.1 dihydroxyacetone kinase subunit DhaK [Brucella sp. NBRC 113783]RLL73310.1 dihydroxyacetone kinase subunit DhaK [[Ochrobactrum] soli]
MKKFLNDPVNFVDEMLEGIYRAHPELTFVNDDKRCMVTATPKAGKVGIATGGGSGHLPTFLGYIGENMIDGAAVGGVFQSPSAEQMYQVTKAIDQGAGVLYIYGNYTGDIINFDMAAELADLDGITVKQVVGNDDVASSVVGEEHKRRGVAGIFFIYKAAGAAAANGLSLDEVTRLADKARLRTRTMGVALSSCVVPEIGHATFSIGDDEMEIGMGIHGEPGISRTKLAPADSVVDQLLGRIFAEQDYAKGDEVAVLLNGLGGTPLEELYIMFRRVAQLFDERGVKVKHIWIGEFATAMEMAGASISVLHLDDELEPLIAASANTPFFKHIAG